MWRLRLHVLQQRNGHIHIKGEVEFARDKGQNPCRTAFDNGPIDAVKMGQALFPVVLVLDEFHMLVLFQADELAGIDRRIAARQQCHERGLLAFQMEGRLVIVIGGDLVQVLVPGFARVLAQLGLAYALY